MAKKTKASVGPRAELVLTCDSIARDPGTGKSTLYGLFDRINAEKFPATSSFWVFAKLVGAKGEQTVTFQVQDAKGRPLIDEPPTLTYQAKPDKAIEVAIHFRQVEFHKPSNYFAAVQIGKRTIGKSYRLIVVKRKKQQ